MPFYPPLKFYKIIYVARENSNIFIGKPPIFLKIVCG
jgi:hypothetical protein